MHRRILSAAHRHLPSCARRALSTSSTASFPTQTPPAPTPTPARSRDGRRPAFAQPFFFQYPQAQARMGRCLKWGCKEPQLDAAAAAVRNLALNWHTQCAAAVACFRVDGAQVLRVNPTTASLTRAGVVPVNQLFQNVTGADERFYMKHHEVNVRKATKRRAKDGEKVISFTSFKLHAPPPLSSLDPFMPAGPQEESSDLHVAFATHLFYQPTREFIATVQVISQVMAPPADVPRIRAQFERLREDNRARVTAGRKFCYLLEKDIRQLESDTWNNENAVEDLGSAAVVAPAMVVAEPVAAAAAATSAEAEAEAGAGADPKST